MGPSAAPRAPRHHGVLRAQRLPDLDTVLRLAVRHPPIGASTLAPLHAARDDRFDTRTGRHVSERLIEVGNGFWNIRGDFRIGGVLNIGTQASLVRRADGRFLMLDGYTLRGELLQQVRELTDDGALLDAIIHLHPFHTVHVQAAHAQFPGAKLYGTCRHHERFPDLPWQAERSESPECAALFAGELEFSVPEGVVFVSPNENLHFSSVLAWHPASKTIHSDDTLMVLRAPGPLGRLLPPAVRFHMTLAQTLERRARRMPWPRCHRSRSCVACSSATAGRVCSERMWRTMPFARSPRSSLQAPGKALVLTICLY